MDTTAAVTFVAVFVAVFTGHQVGDYWVQSSCQAARKGERGWAGRWACTRHVLGLTATKAVLLVPTALILGLHLSALGVVLGLGVDALTHWWADRRTTLAWLAKVTGKAEFYGLGADVLDTSTAEDGITGRHLGRGSHALDQSFHVLWLFVASLIVAVL
ncbi:transcriptional regulator [Kitasatospora sp. NPDC059160]|uniref:transcriptional regulator n=1 Tax=Kitasatospora sp. NPDC059160 TaxID=3346748 RepID=UPI0036C491BF